jgi:hypothetical protein
MFMEGKLDLNMDFFKLLSVLASLFAAAISWTLDVKLKHSTADVGAQVGQNGTTDDYVSTTYGRMC